MDQEFYINLIIKQLSEGITDVEQTELESWLQNDVKNQTLLEDIKKTWSQSDKYKSDYRANQAKAWANVEKSIKGGKVIPFKRSYQWASIAATILLLLSIGWFVNSSNNSTTHIYSSNNEQLDVTLPDGSLVSLNENSSLSYKKKFKTRDIELNGEAFFDVQHNPKKPFTVYANSTETAVLGTTFNVSAYENQTQIDVALFTGKIAFKANNIEPIIVKPGETVSYDLTNKRINKEITKSQNITAWKTRQLIFEQTSLFEVVTTLEEFYKTDIQLNIPEENSCVFTGKFEEASLEKVIDVLSFTYELDYEKNETTHLITIKNCN